MLKLTDIVFPVYPIKSHKRTFRGKQGALFLELNNGNIYAIDDTSLPGDFGLRRLQLQDILSNKKDIGFYKLSVAYYNWQELLTRTTKYVKFIDNTGRLFTYKNSNKFVKLVYHKIKKLEILEGKHCYLLVNDLSVKFKLPRPIDLDQYKYAGVLYSDVGFLLYHLSTEKLPDSRRKL